MKRFRSLNQGTNVHMRFKWYTNVNVFVPSGPSMLPCYTYIYIYIYMYSFVRVNVCFSANGCSLQDPPTQTHVQHTTNKIIQKLYKHQTIPKQPQHPPKQLPNHPPPISGAAMVWALADMALSMALALAMALAMASTLGHGRGHTHGPWPWGMTMASGGPRHTLTHIKYPSPPLTSAFSPGM